MIGVSLGSFERRLIAEGKATDRESFRLLPLPFVSLRLPKQLIGASLFCLSTGLVHTTRDSIQCSNA